MDDGLQFDQNYQVEDGESEDEIDVAIPEVDVSANNSSKDSSPKGDLEDGSAFFPKIDCDNLD